MRLFHTGLLPLLTAMLVVSGCARSDDNMENTGPDQPQAPIPILLSASTDGVSGGETPNPDGTRPSTALTLKEGPLTPGDRIRAAIKGFEIPYNSNPNVPSPSMSASWGIENDAFSAYIYFNVDTDPQAITWGSATHEDGSSLKYYRLESESVFRTFLYAWYPAGVPYSAILRKNHPEITDWETKAPSYYNRIYFEFPETDRLKGKYDLIATVGPGYPHQTAGAHTVGSSTSPIERLRFIHLTTQLNFRFVLDPEYTKAMRQEMEKSGEDQTNPDVYNDPDQNIHVTDIYFPDNDKIAAPNGISFRVYPPEAMALPSTIGGSDRPNHPRLQAKDALVEGGRIDPTKTPGETIYRTMLMMNHTEYTGSGGNLVATPIIVDNWVLAFQVTNGRKKAGSDQLETYLHKVRIHRTGGFEKGKSYIITVPIKFSDKTQVDPKEEDSDTERTRAGRLPDAIGVEETSWIPASDTAACSAERSARLQ